VGGTAKSQLRGRRAAAGLAAKGDPGWVKWLITGASLCFLLLFLGVPLVAVFAEALRKGLGAYLESFQNRDALSAIRLTLLVAAIAVPLNLVFGLAAPRVLLWVALGIPSRRAMSSRRYPGKAWPSGAW